MSDKIEEKEVKKDDKTYRLIEMSDAMELSIKNLTDVIEQQKSLINIVETNDTEKKLAEFVKDTKVQLTSLEKQLTTLTARHEKLLKANDMISKDADVKEAANCLFDALGMFE